MSNSNGLSAIDVARHAIVHGDYQQAYHLLTAFLAEHPEHLDALFLISRIAYDHKNFQKEAEWLGIA